MGAEELMRLVERCEAATGADREIDALIAPIHGLRIVDEGHPIGRVCYDENGHGVPLPAYTASLDAAMSLIPADHEWSVNWGGNSVASVRALPDGIDNWGHAETPALALCAAALRARATNLIEGSEK